MRVLFITFLILFFFLSGIIISQNRNLNQERKNNLEPDNLVTKYAEIKVLDSISTLMDENIALKEKRNFEGLKEAKKIIANHERENQILKNEAETLKKKNTKLLDSIQTLNTMNPSIVLDSFCVRWKFLSKRTDKNCTKWIQK